MKQLRRLFSNSIPAKSGQAMTEYAIIAALMTLVAVAPIIPGQSGNPPVYHSFMSYMIDAYRTYYVSYYYVLNLPFP